MDRWELGDAGSDRMANLEPEPEPEPKPEFKIQNRNRTCAQNCLLLFESMQRAIFNSIEFAPRRFGKRNMIYIYRKNHIFNYN